MQVEIAYHFFANYRQPIINQLLGSENEYMFVGDSKSNTAGVPVSKIPADRFCEVRSYKFFKVFLVQPMLIWRSITTDADAYIFLGDAKFLTTWIAAIILRVRSKRVLYWTHGWVAAPKGISGLYKKLFYRLANGLLLYGERARDIALSQGFDRDDVYVIYNSLDEEGLQKAAASVSVDALANYKREQFGSSNSKILFCSGRLTAAKRLDMVIEAASQLRSRGFDAVVCFIGDGEERERLEVCACELDVPTHFVGKSFDPEDVAFYTMAASVTVCPEAAGLSVMQSMILGVPVVTNDCFEGQMPESEAVLTSVTGGLYKKGSIKSLSDAIQKIIELDYGAYILMQERAKDLMTRYYSSRYQEKVISRACSGAPATYEKFSQKVER